ncbi:MAG: ABC transporter substrate-binding protein, partial [Caldivirga sp.]
MNTKSHILLAIAAAMLTVYSASVVYASSSPSITIIEAIPSTVIISPGVPLWNPYIPGNQIGTIGTWMPLALYNPVTGQFYPILAESWVIFPDNHTLIVHLRRGLYWFNGSATIPFTA